jgi:hypothetical protein
MNAKEMLDKAVQIIARSDVDRTLMLLFMNSARKAVVRNNEIPKLTQYLLNVPMENGTINTSEVINSYTYFTGDLGYFTDTGDDITIDNGSLGTLNLKSVNTVEYDDGTRKTTLVKFADYDSARYYYPDFSRTGTPQHYLLLGTKIYILPFPSTGAINLVVELWPADLIDDSASLDILTTEIPEAWIYLAVAEYFDYFDEADKGNYWRQKGSVLVQQYIIESQYEDAKGTDDCVSSYYAPERVRSDY